MDQKTFTLLAGVVFAIVALLHLLRIYMAWPVVIGDWTVPMWVSWIALVVAAALSYFGLSPTPMTQPTKEQKVDRIARAQRALAFALPRLCNAPRR
jgi:hypothetical protein